MIVARELRRYLGTRWPHRPGADACAATPAAGEKASHQGKAKRPGSPVAGRANVFVFPDLDTGNTTWKAVQHSAQAISVGPMLQGRAIIANVGLLEQSLVAQIGTMDVLAHVRGSA